MRIVYLIILLTFLVFGIVINVELDKDFLKQVGFTGSIVLISIIFFIGIKTLSEILFFSLKKGFTKVLVGSFTLFLILSSISSVFMVRMWKSEKMLSEKENLNELIVKNNQEINSTKKRLNDQLISIEKQILSRQRQINRLDSYDDKWLILRYNKTTKTLSDQKTLLIEKISQTEKSEIPVTQKKTSLHQSLNRIFGTSGETFIITVNLILSLIIDLSLLLLTFGLSYVWKSKKKEHLETRVRKERMGVNRTTSQSKIGREENIMFYDEEPVTGEKLKELRSNLGLSQSELSDMLGTNQRKLSRVENGQSKPEKDWSKRLMNMNIL